MKSDKYGTLKFSFKQCTECVYGSTPIYPLHEACINCIDNNPFYTCYVAKPTNSKLYEK